MFKSTSIYILSSIFTAIVPFVLLPILTRVFSPDIYGQIAMYMILISITSAFVGVNTLGAIERKFFDNESEVELIKYNGNVLIILLCSFILLILLVFCIEQKISNFFDIPNHWLYIVLVHSFCQFLVTFRLGQWQIRTKAKNYALLQIVNALLNLIVSLFLILSLEIGEDGRIYGILSSMILCASYSLYSLVKDKLIEINVKKNYLMEQLRYGVPLIPHVLGGIAVLSMDRIIISKELGLNYTGMYMAAASLVGALNLVFHSVNRAYTPWLFSKLKLNDYAVNYKIVKYTYLYFFALIFVGLLAYFVGPLIFKLIVGEQYHPAATIIPVLVAGQLFLGMYLMVTNYVFYAKKTKYISITTLFSGGVNVLLLILLVPEFYLYGAAYAFLIANFLLFILTWFISARVYKMPWSAVFVKMLRRI